MNVMHVTSRTTSVIRDIAYLVGGTLFMVAPVILWFAGIV